MTLVITEKPSVGAALASVLGAKERKDGCIEGNGWIITWCVGHLVELAPADAYDERFKRWNYADLPILPDTWRFNISEGKKKQLDVIKRLMSDKTVDSVICATDAGREGELIFRLVYDYCGCKKPVKRLWISSMEDAAIREGFEKLRPGADYENLYRAALCRSQADWIVGINATRLFSVLYNTTLNCGRVQTPTLAMVVQREHEIAAFKPMPFYTPEIDCRNRVKCAAARLESCDGSTQDSAPFFVESEKFRGTFTASGERLNDAAAADAVRTACNDKAAVVRSALREKKTAAPPQLYDLTTLQREANRLFGFTAQQTLDYTQALYEKKLVTYPRTNSRFITSVMAAGIPALVKSVTAVMPFAKGLNIPAHTAQISDDSKVTDHHAIIPTAELAKTNLYALPSGERDVLMMIAARLLCAVGEKHSFETVSVVLDCEGYGFTSKGRTVLFDGWKAVEKAFRAAIKSKPEEDSDGDEDTKVLPELLNGQVFSPVKAFVREGRTSPPRRYTEDTLLAAMESAGGATARPGAHRSSESFCADEGDEDMPEITERRGLGTPATRAGVIERLIKSGFIERKKRLLYPTEKGCNLVTVLPEVIKSPKLTAVWEHRLQQIQSGELDDKVFMTDIAAMTLGLVKAHPAPDKEYAALFATSTVAGNAAPGDIVGLCPRCGSDVTEKTKGFFCSSRACSFALWKDNRFFTAMKKTITKAVVTALLKEGRVFISDLFSEKTGKTYGATVVLDDTGNGYVNFKLVF